MASANHRPRIGIIGGGHLGRIHAKLASSNTNCELIGVADPSSDSRGVVASQLGLATIDDYRGWKGCIDAAIIAAPTFLHHEIGTWCLRHGIHVFLEKPIASTLEQANDLVSMAKTHGRVLQIGHVERFNPVWKAAQATLASGNIRYIEAAREGTYTGRSTDIGIVMDLMIHDIDLVLSLMDSPVEDVGAYGWAVLGEHEDFACASIRFENGTIAQLRASRISPNAKRQMQVYSDAGLVEIDFALGSMTSIAAHAEVAQGLRKADQLPSMERAKVKDSLFTEWLERTESKPPTSNAIEQEQIEFVQSIRGMADVTVTGQHGRNALALACQILEQIERSPDVRQVIPWSTKLAKPKAA
jgi:predicted dehydrogenase